MGLSVYPDPDSQPATSTPITLGYAQATAGQNGITSMTDLVGLAVTVTVPAGRRLRITGWAQVEVVTTAGAVYGLVLQDGAEAGRWVYDDGALVGHHTYMGSVILSPTAGTHTYKLQLAKWNGGNTINLIFGTFLPPYILVEDITGSSLPAAPATTPVGRLAYSVGVTDTFTTEKVLNGYTANVVVPAGRTLRITARGHVYSAGTGGQAALFRVWEDGVEIGGAQKTNLVNPTVSDFWEVETIRSPAAGAHTYTATGFRNTGADTLTNRIASNESGYILVEDITPTPALAATAPSSTLAYVERTTSQTGITSTTDITGLAATFTVPAGRRVRVTARIFGDNQGGSVGSMWLEIMEGANRLHFGQVYVTANATNGDQGTIEATAIVSPTAGAHTYKLRAGATGSTDFGGFTNAPAYLLIEDITGVSIPAPDISALFLNPPRVKLYRTANQSIGNNQAWASNIVLWTAESYDTALMHDLSSNTDRITIQTAGTYHFDVRLNYASNATGHRGLRVWKNNATDAAHDSKTCSTGGGIYVTCSASFDMACAVGDFFIVNAFQDSGGALDIAGGNEGLGYFSARWVAP